MNVLVVDIGGTYVKVLVTGQTEARKVLSGPTMTPGGMVNAVKRLRRDWKYDVISIGYPWPALHNRPTAEPHQLAPGWVGFERESVAPQLSGGMMKVRGCKSDIVGRKRATRQP